MDTITCPNYYHLNPDNAESGSYRTRPQERCQSSKWNSFSSEAAFAQHLGDGPYFLEKTLRMPKFPLKYSVATMAVVITSA